jgi:hypothetical protein
VEMHSCSSSHDDDLRSNSDRARRPRIGRTTIFLVAAFSFVFVTSVATAATLTLGLDYEFSGGAEPVSATTPWVTITLDDSFGGPNTVRMTFEATNLTGGTTGESVNGRSSAPPHACLPYPFLGVCLGVDLRNALRGADAAFLCGGRP